MLGFGRRKVTDEDTQIPYQVYETVNEPANRRRRLILRLIATLLIATLLIALFLWWQRSSDDDVVDVPAGQSQQFQQPPQTNENLPQPAGGAAPTPLSDVRNDKTIDQPQ